MKVVILCGGYGTRLAGVGSELPKPMVPVGGKPIVWHIMKGMAHWGFREFILCLGYRSDTFKQYFLNLAAMLGDVTVDLAGRQEVIMHSKPGEMDWKITLAETGLDSMTGHRVKLIEPHLQGDTEFALTYGDGVTNLDFRKVIAFHQSHRKMATVTAVHPPARFGELAIGNAGQVAEFNEKPQATAGWISGGFFVLSRNVFQVLSDSPKLVLEREPMQQLARDGQLMAYQHPDFWFCMDTPRDHQQLQEMWASGSAPWAVWQ